MYYAYKLSRFCDIDTICDYLKKVCKRDLERLYANIIYMEHDLRTVAEIPAEDALKYALEDNGIRLGDSDIWKYAFRFDTNKVGALNAIMQERAWKLKHNYPMADMSFRLYYGKVDGAPVVGLESVHENYFHYLEKQPYIKDRVRSETLWGTTSLIMEHAQVGLEYNMEPLTLEELLNYKPADIGEKGRRITMIITNDDVMDKVKKLPGWNEANSTNNPADWIKKREDVAKSVIDDKEWKDILLEETGFDPNRKPDIKKNLKRLANPIRGILVNVHINTRR